MRVISSNALKRAATFTALTTAGAMPLSNVLTDDKTECYQSVGPVAQLTARWDAPERMSAFVLPICGLSPTAQMRVRVSTEGGKINRARYSEQLDNAAWVKTAATVTANAVTAPDGTLTADKVVDTTAATTGHYLTQSVTGLPQGQKLSVSVFVKAAERSIFCLRFDSSSTAAPTASNIYVNLTTGAMTGLISAGWTYKVEAYPDGWFRVKAEGTTTAAGTLSPRFMLSTSGTNYNYTGDGTSGLYMWGLQIEYDEVSSYYPAVASAGVRPSGYMVGWQNYSFDTGYVNCSEAEQIILEGWTAAQSATAYTYGGGTCAQVWFPEQAATGIIVDINDPNNALGAINIAKAVCGPYWETKYHASNVTHRTVDTSVVKRTNADTQTGQAGNIHKAIPITLSMMPPQDRKQFVKLVRMSKMNPIFVSIYPGHWDKDLERDLSIYGRRPDDSDIELEFAEAYSTDLTIEEI